MNQPDVTIGLPVLDGAGTLAAALDSVLAQTYTGWRLIVADNRSTDGTLAVARSYAARDRRIEVRQRPARLPVFDNFRALALEAETPYFAFIGADDRWEPGFLASTRQALLAAPDAVAATGRVLLGYRSAAGTFPVTAPEPWRRVRDFLRSPADNSRFYGLFSTEVLQRAHARRAGHEAYGYDWYLMVLTLLEGAHVEVPEVLVHRGPAPPGKYLAHHRRTEAGVMARHFPLAPVTALVFRADARVALRCLPQLLRLNARAWRALRLAASPRLRALVHWARGRSS